MVCWLVCFLFVPLPLLSPHPSILDYSRRWGISLNITTIQLCHECPLSQAVTPGIFYLLAWVRFSVLEVQAQEKLRSQMASALTRRHVTSRESALPSVRTPFLDCGCVQHSPSWYLWAKGSVDRPKASYVHACVVCH